MSAAPLSRAALVERILSRLSGHGARATVIQGPRGSGKREILTTVARRLDGAGIHPLEIDFARCAVHPGEMACAIAAACIETALGPPQAGGGPTAPPEERLRSLASSPAIDRLGAAVATAREILIGLDAEGSPGAPLVAAALRMPGELAAAAGGQVVVIAHSLDHASRLAHYPGLRAIDTMLSRSLRSGLVRLAASVSPEGRPSPLLEALRKALGEQLDLADVPRLDRSEIGLLAGGPGSAEHGLLADVTAGRLLTAKILAGSLAEGSRLADAIMVEMAPGDGRLFHEIRFDYHLLIERTRGHAACRAVLAVLAREEGLDLSGVATRLRRSPGSTLDYLKWLSEVGLVVREGRRYRYRDPLMRLYVLLFELPEGPGDRGDRSEVIHRFLGDFEKPPIPLRPLGRPRGSRSGPRRRGPERVATVGVPSPRSRGDDLMEID